MATLTRIREDDNYLLITTSFDALPEDGLFAGDVLTVDKNKDPRSGDIVLAGYGKRFVILPFYDVAKIEETLIIIGVIEADAILEARLIEDVLGSELLENILEAEVIL